MLVGARRAVDATWLQADGWDRVSFVTYTRVAALMLNLEGSTWAETPRTCTCGGQCSHCVSFGKRSGHFAIPSECSKVLGPAGLK